MNGTTRTTTDLEISRAILRRWHEDVPNDRLAHLVKDTWRAFQRSLVGAARAPGHRARPLDVPARAVGARRHHAARARDPGRRLGAGDARRDPRDGEGGPRRCASTSAGNRKNVYIVLTRTGKALRRKLVPLAVTVNAVATRGVKPADVATTRRTLLAILDNLTFDEVGADRVGPAARALDNAPPAGHDT